jgi:F-type H+/Na+-transporting ATPase subunit alpha
MFARFGTRLDEKTRETIERGRRVRKVLTQPELKPMPIPEQIAMLLAVTNGLFDVFEVNEIPNAEKLVREAITTELTEICLKIENGELLAEEDTAAIIEAARNAIEVLLKKPEEEE